VNHTLRREIGVVISERLDDPRLPKMTSVTRVECSADMRDATVSVSVLGPAGERSQALVALASASGLIRHELGERVRMKNIPRLHFKLDTTMAEAQDMLTYMDRVAAEDRKQAGRRDASPPGTSPTAKE
jgi:ribosome-binding factor A